MPELPEVEVVRRSLLPLVGVRLQGVTGFPIKLRRPLDPDTWRRQLGGRILEDLERHGKYLVWRFGSVSAVIHLGMSGRLLLCEESRSPQPHTHLILHFEGGRAVDFVDPRRFGLAEVVPTSAVPGISYLAGLGEDALLGDVGGVLARALPRSRSTVWSVLLDQRVLAGVGNIYANEALARAGIAPVRPANRVSAAARRRLAAEIPRVLAEAVEEGGTTLTDGGFVSGEFRSGYFAVRLQVYDRAGMPCYRCGAEIRRLRQSGRSVYFCPRCQR